MRASKCERVVVVGGGYIGLEMAEAFVNRGAKVALLESGPHVMSTLDPEIAGRVSDALRRHRRRRPDGRPGHRVRTRAWCTPRAVRSPPTSSCSASA